MRQASCLVSSPEDRSSRLRAALARASRVLPAQGPIGVFVHHNTLHAYEHLPFHEAVATASETLGAEGYLSEARFLELYRQGRITDEDLRAVLAQPGAWSPPPPPALLFEEVSGVDRAALGPEALTLLALLHPVEEETEASLRWKREEHSAARRFRADLAPALHWSLVERSARGLHVWMDRVGRDWTMTELACALLTPDLEATVRDVAMRLPRPLPRDVSLRLLGVPATRAEVYAARVAAQLEGVDSPTVEGWLSAEVTCVRAALSAAFGGNGSLDSLRKRLERAPEPFAVSALWSLCRTPPLKAETRPSAAVTQVLSHRELLCRATGEDVNDLLHPHLIRACAAFLDEGHAHWPMPERERGFHAAWVALMREGLGARPDWMEGLDSELSPSRSADDTVLETLDALGVPEAEWEPYLARVLLALRGWAGMMHRLEQHPADRASNAPPARLMDFVAVRLTLERFALLAVARRRLGDSGTLSHLSEATRRALASAPRPERPRGWEGWRFFQWAQLLGLSAMDVMTIPTRERQALLSWLEDFDTRARQRVWQEAYEHHYRMELSRGLECNRLRPSHERTVTKPRFQVLFCMDDREESFRRHFEELDAKHETLGIAGFFGVAFDYQGLDDANAVALCPVVVTPAHAVEERACPEHEPLAKTRAHRRTRWARLEHVLRQGTHALELSWLLAPLLGLLSAPWLLLRLLFPRAVSQWRRGLTTKLLPRPRTRLTSHRDTPLLPRAGKPRGFTLDEQAARVAASLESMGLTKSFAPLVVLLGHGAVSVNNPHQAAYDCGACGGRHGGPNARLFAELANRPEVRAKLQERGLLIPASTWFIGGLHNTTTDEVTLHDADCLPPSHHGELAALREALDRARALSAQERCRRFESARPGLSPAMALRHVEERAEDLGQPRPELGHVTNAACIIGRRALTRGLFMDRRVFLISYDPSQDASGVLVERILLAAGPVGAGISLEYYFSCVDNARHGCGSKLPHNVTGLLGVMDGASSDLRTGLPRQMIEIHEPMRLLLYVEASTQVLSAILERQPPLRDLIGNEWMRLASIDPVTGEQQLFTAQGFQPLEPSMLSLPHVASSPDWCRGHHDFLPPALIRAPSGWPRPLTQVPPGGARHDTC
ncbi:hypothetical protein MYSTI_00687 [Myxococcus stipitatus DSM 14675]|uniref:Probable inorganic carbon transporter subunit DabA n=1 Tax=Myxococcus stipitatus (strain DSM 14675 / JCM 12634 / Mx s8) TaxID=1278073 RepID=L7U386_MYXSD|nr:DUF2309 domain-containing protein [Myxococcus stipitatus]AGC42037.1 hypothetical protein MYSTI_00687 [Myxococcus stipitatus DSM 14675]